jgi:lethal(2) giant larvae protein
VGTFDPYSDDPRLSIVKIALCPLSETLVLGGSAGQVVALQFERERRQHEVKVTNVSIVTDRDTFVWKGHEALRVREGDVDFVPGFQPVCVMQMTPPAACTALALHSEWQM